MFLSKCSAFNGKKKQYLVNNKKQQEASKLLSKVCIKTLLSKRL